MSQTAADKEVMQFQWQKLLDNTHKKRTIRRGKSQKEFLQYTGKEGIYSCSFSGDWQPNQMKNKDNYIKHLKDRTIFMIYKTSELVYLVHEILFKIVWDDDFKLENKLQTPLERMLEEIISRRDSKDLVNIAKHDLKTLKNNKKNFKLTAKTCEELFGDDVIISKKLKLTTNILIYGSIC